MKINIMKKAHYLPLLLFLLVHENVASNLANPAITLPEARIAIGASYHLGGYALSNREVPSLFNRIHARVEYSPIKYLTFGFDGGTMQIEVDKYVSGRDTIPVFHGKYGYSGGGHIKLATPPFLNNRISFIAIAQATMFNSENGEVLAGYKGKDGTGAIGVQFHLPGFGYVSAGPLAYIIKGENSSFNGSKSTYSNVDNIRGWLAIDYFPKVAELSKNKPYISFEFSISPSATVSERLPFQAISASISIGSITRRLYGTESEVEWSP